MVYVVMSNAKLNYQLFRRVFCEVAGSLPKEQITIVSGDPGQEEFSATVKEFADRNHLPFVAVPCDKKRFGSWAPYRRNEGIMEKVKDADDVFLLMFSAYSSGVFYDLRRKCEDAGFWIRNIQIAK